MPKDDRPFVRGNHLPGSKAVDEGGKAPSPGSPGHAKPSASKAKLQGKPEAGTSRATVGEAEMEHAAVMGAQKPQAKH